MTTKTKNKPSKPAKDVTYHAPDEDVVETKEQKSARTAKEAMAKIEANKTKAAEAKAKAEQRKAEKAEAIEAKRAQAAERKALKASEIAEAKAAREKAKAEAKAKKDAEKAEKKAAREAARANAQPKRLTEQMIQAKGHKHIVEGSLRFETDGEWKGKQTVEIKTKGANGRFDGNTRRIATSDLHQVFHTEEVTKELRKLRAKERRSEVAKLMGHKGKA